MAPKSTSKADVIPLDSVQGRCPLCEQPIAADYRPFCSKRCAERDLGRWLNEGYRIETDEAPESGEGPDSEQ